MSSKTSADVLIGGRVYNLSGYESENYLQQIASYLNRKIDEVAHLSSDRNFPEEMREVLLELNIADDYFKEMDRAQKLEQDLEDRNQEIYDLKHELVSLKIQLEEEEDLKKELEQENKELLLLKAKLETSLEDALSAKSDHGYNKGAPPKGRGRR